MGNKNSIVKSSFLTNRRSKRLKKGVTALSTGLCMTVMLSMMAFASGISVSSGSFMSTAETAVTAVVTLIGGGVGIFGVINLIEAYSNDNPEARSSGMKQLAAGIGLIICAQLLVPALFDMVTGL